MQVHLNGHQGSGDPLHTQYSFSEEPDFQSHLPASVDVLIIGAGPAGQLLATQLSRFPNIVTRVVEKKPGPLEQGNADGLQCRTLEVLAAFGFAERVLKEAYWVNETCIWSPAENGTGLKRSARIRDTEHDLSEMPHVILNQARLQEMWLDSMKWSPTRLEPTYSRKMVKLKKPEGDEQVEVTLERVDAVHQGERETIKATYVVGCDGARSSVRTALGLKMEGDYKNQVWGVLDALVVTNFPDLRLKCTIRSAREGTILTIPREGGYLVRFYVEMDENDPNDRSSCKKITKELIMERARGIFDPFTFDVREVAYWSVYEVGQRLTSHFDDVDPPQREQRHPRIFIAGDACHTHSAKAGQGMNVSMNDAFNLGWKLASVLQKTAVPKILHTYNEERHSIAKKLIDFDGEMSAMMATRHKSTNFSTALAPNHAEDSTRVEATAFQFFIQRKASFMAGVETTYESSTLITLPLRKCQQNLAKGFQLGTRLHSSPVLRCADARSVHLGHCLIADGRWRILIFDDNRSHPSDKQTALWKTCNFLEQDLLPRFTPRGSDIDSIIDVRAVFQASRETIDITHLHPLLFPGKGKLGLRDYEKAFTDEHGYDLEFESIYKTRRIDRENGCLLVVRPDHHISGVLRIGCEEMMQTLIDFFSAFLILQHKSARAVEE